MPLKVTDQRRNDMDMDEKTETNFSRDKFDKKKVTKRKKK